MTHRLMGRCVLPSRVHLESAPGDQESLGHAGGGTHQNVTSDNMDDALVQQYSDPVEYEAILAVLRPKVMGKSPSECEEALGMGPPMLTVRSKPTGQKIRLFDARVVNATFLQPFLTYTFKSNTTIGLNSETTYDWNANQWTVPLNGFVSQLVRFGKLPVQFQLGGRYYLETPDGGPDWGLRFAVTFLLPK